MPDPRHIEQEDHELLRRMAAKDAAALDLFYERYNRLAFSLVMRIVGNRADAEDVLLDVFWQAWQQASRYDASRGKPVSWLLTIARTRAIDCIRSVARQKTTGDQPEDTPGEIPTPGATDMFILADVRQAVQEALRTLSEEQRQPLELAYFDGMSHSEIAAALRQPLGTVKDRIRTGMAHLRKRLKAYL